MAKKCYIGATNFERVELPAGYTQIEYIEVNGTQYIDTGFTPNQDTRLVCDFKLDAANISGNNFLGSRQSTSAKAFAFGTVSSKWRFGYNNSSAQTSITADAERHVVDMDKNVCKLDGVIIDSKEYATFTGYTSIRLGVIYASSAYAGYGKIYSCQIYDDGTLVRDLIPCTNAEGAVGMYDLENGVFYGNAGTDTLAAGSVYTNAARLVNKMYIGIDGVAKKVKKAYIGVNGIARLCFAPFIDPIVTYSGNHTNEVVTMGDGKKYRLLTLTSTGTLTLDSAVSAEVWLCGGGAKGSAASIVDENFSSSGRYGTVQGGNGGNGGGFYQYETEIPKSIVVTIGAGNGGVTSVGSVKSSGHYSGAGGGGGGKVVNTSYNTTETVGAGGAAASKSTKPFEDSYFTKLPCAGGGGGQARITTSSATSANGSAGGSSNTKGAVSANTGNTGPQMSGDGGATGGGKGAYSNSTTDSSFVNPTAASYYGSGGGGGATHDRLTTGGNGSGGANGYQGVVFIRIPLE